MAAVVALAPIANADTAPAAGLQAAQTLAQQLVTAAKSAEAADQGAGKSSVAVEADIEAAVLAQIRDSSQSPDVVATALSIARRTGGIDSAISVALGNALTLALGVQTAGPGSVGRPGGQPPFGRGGSGGNGGGGGGSGYRGNGH
jgi:hypothetical protein